MDIKPNYNLVKQDNNLHTIWINGDWSIKGYSGESGNISLHLYLKEKAMLVSHSLRNIVDFISEFTETKKIENV